MFFAIGLCIHLTDISPQVARPVLAITLTFSGAYLVATVLPLVFKTCPYSTPLSSVYLRTIRPVEQALLLLLKSVIRFIRSSMSYVTPKTIGRLERADERLADKTKMASTSLDWDEYTAFGELSHEHNEVPLHWRGSISLLEEAPLGEITCRKLKWLITYSENNNSVNLALQLVTAIPRHVLEKHMFKGPYINLLSQRLNNCFWIKDGVPYLKGVSSTNLVLRYCRALSSLVTSHPQGLSHKSFRSGTTANDIKMIIRYCNRYASC